MGDRAANDERRRHPRVASGFSVVELTGQTTYFQYATNLSEGGLFLERTLPHPPGTRVALLFKVPHQREPIAVEAEVLGGSSEGQGMRLRFVDLDQHPELLERVRGLVEKVRTAA